MNHAAPPERSPHFRLAELILAFSVATDLGMGQPVGATARTTLLAVRFATALNFPLRRVRDIYYLALLHYLGCTTDAHRVAALLGDDLNVMRHVLLSQMGQLPDTPGVPHLSEPPSLNADFARNSSVGRCEVAVQLADACGLWPDVQASLWQLFERWDGRGLPNALRGTQIAAEVRVVQLARDAETFHRLGGVTAALAALKIRAGAGHDPSLVEAFRELGPDLLHALAEEASPRQALLALEPAPHVHITPDQQVRLLEALSDFAELKSPFILGHARRAADRVAAAATHLRLPASDVRELRLAALVQDVGRVAVPATTWQKPARLSEGEWEQVRLHPYHTERILTTAASLASLATLAPLHHERPNGQGYFKALRGHHLPFGAHLLAAVDTYEAMTAPRPHRAAFSEGDAVRSMRAAAQVDQLHSAAVDAVLHTLGHPRAIGRTRRPADLSAREVEVLRLVSRGHTNKAIASTLGITPKTVGHHVQHIYEKLGVSTRAGATLFALQHHLLT